MSRQRMVIALLEWYRSVRRDLPWRTSRDPYKIWVSEIMLQQTRVDTVVPYYQRFIELFPSIEDLAKAPRDEVLKAWEGLGYYSRVRNLHDAAREVEVKYGGEVPADYHTMLTLPGVGAYTAGAVLSIAFNVPEPAVDGNVLRVFARWTGLADDIGVMKTKRKVEEEIRKIIPRESGDFNQSLMELGALVCVPRHPLCHECPVAFGCEAFQSGRQEDLPVRAKKAPVQELHLAAGLICASESASVLIRKRPTSGLLADLWELPHVVESDDWAHTFASTLAEVGIQVQGNWVYLGDYKHGFTHLKWRVSLYCVSGYGEPNIAAYRFADAAMLQALTFAKVFRQMLQEHNRFFLPSVDE